MVKVAKQFLATARFSAEQSHAAPSVDNLFSACELISKAHLTLYHNRAAKAKQHAAVSSALNAWGKIGNVAADFVKLFNRLSNARSAARYEAAQVDCPTLVDFEVVEREAAQLEKAVAQKRRES